MIGIELAIEGAPTVKACLERRLLINCTHGTVIRLLPAMTLDRRAGPRGLRHPGRGVQGPGRTATRAEALQEIHRCDIC